MSITTAAQKISVEYYECVYIGAGVGYYLTNAPYDISLDTGSGAQNYTAFGQLLGFDTIEENTDLSINNLSIIVSGIAPNSAGETAIRDLIDTEYANKPVSIYRLYWEDGVRQSSYLTIYKGYITGATLTFGTQNESTVKLDTSNQWHDFSRRSGRRTNTSSQQSYFANDLGFEFAVEVQKEIKWKTPA